jgi:hypothetical protein
MGKYTVPNLYGAPHGMLSTESWGALALTRPSAVKKPLERPGIEPAPAATHVGTRQHAQSFWMHAVGLLVEPDPCPTARARQLSRFQVGLSDL